jgi:hypothetical protein
MNGNASVPMHVPQTQQLDQHKVGCLQIRHPLPLPVCRSVSDAAINTAPSREEPHAAPAQRWMVHTRALYICHFL